MGMFDWLVTDEYETQVKCFYTPIYTNGEVWHSGGHGDVYRIGDPIPTKTMYYEYPDDFYLYLAEYEEYRIAVIRNGKFDGFIKNLADATEFNNFYTYYGEKIKARNLNDMLKYENELQDEYAKDPSVRNFVKFWEKWHEEIPLKHKIGELFKCWNFCKMYAEIKSDNPFKERYIRDYESITRDINKFRAEHPDIFDEFIREYEIEWE
jgi:hypothetical protein